TQDALEFIIAGASAVGIGTALFYEPLLCPEINQGIVDYLERENIDNVSDLVGTLKLHGGEEGEECSG
ncbi:MAG TPA: dihydroorotate dehydrogenase, partial [Gammaproteobacteria bacterium]|nr:dihydroorotate dehydrogenase [Gammaproteobacteria bacterium]